MGSRAILTPSLVLIAACAIFAPESSSASEVTVSLRSGRSFTGTIDRTSDDRNLRLRFGSEVTKIVRSINWNSVVAAKVEGRDVTATELKQLAAKEREKSTGADAAPTPQLVRPAISRSRPTNSDAASATRPAGGVQLWRVPGRAAATNSPAAVVRSISLDAYPANWDADVDVDGLLVSVTALDDFGRAVPVDGTLEVELIGETLPPYTRGEAFPVLGRWSRQLTSNDSAAVGGTYRERLPFQAAHPDYQLYFPRYSLVHVRLVVPGQGTFEASLDGLSMRGFTPVRDRLQAASGARLLPNEQSGRGKPLSSRELR